MAKLDIFCSFVNLARDSVPGVRPSDVVAEETISLAMECGSRGVEGALLGEEEEDEVVLCCADLDVGDERRPLAWVRRRPLLPPFDEK